MSPRDKRWKRPPPRRKGRLSDCLSLLFLFATVYFIYSFTKFSFTHLAVPRESGPVRGFAVQLNPKDHVPRLPTSITHYWNVTKGLRAPDGVNKTVYLINGEFPGPTIEARVGDQLVFIVSNQLENGEGVAFHWHGLHMRDANHMDGVVGVTQKAIPAGKEFTYKFEIERNQSGTFWYHSHSELQRADGLYGGLVIHDRFREGIAELEKYEYEDEQLLLIGDWYHRSAVDVQSSYLTFRSSGNEPLPDSLLINGLGHFNCSMAVPSQPVECQAVRTPNMKMSPRATRLRIVNVGAMSGFNLTLENANMQVIKIDGGNDIIPSDWVSSVGILYPGERVDILTSGDRAASLTITLDPENFQFMNQALKTTQTFPIDSPKALQGRPRAGAPTRQNLYQSRPKHAVNTGSTFDLSTAKGIEILEPMPQYADQTVLVYTHIEMLAHHDHVPMGYMNRTNWIPQAEPLIYLPREQWDEHQFMPQVEATGEWVDVVVNNIDDKGHPFHLHGHDFYVLTRQAFPRRAGYRTYNPFDPLSPNAPLEEQALYPKPNVENPRLKDTVHIPRRGYVILRIRADNVGIWFFHCHILWHQGTGMAMGLDIR